MVRRDSLDTYPKSLINLTEVQFQSDYNKILDQFQGNFWVEYSNEV